MKLLFKIIVLCLVITLVCSLHVHEHKNAVNTQKPEITPTEKEMKVLAFRQHLVDCTEETKINPDIILKLRSGKWRQALRKEPPALKKWSLCILVKIGMMSPEGVLRQNVVLETVPDKDKLRVEKVINKCLYKKSHSPPDTAWHYIKCFHATYPKYSII